MDVDIDFSVSSNWTPEMEGRMRWLRENEPVFWSEKSGYWVISTFEHVSYVSKHNELFCSGEGVRPSLPITLRLALRLLGVPFLRPPRLIWPLGAAILFRCYFSTFAPWTA